MGNHRLRFSDMIPSSWFHKLKDMGRTRNQNINHPKKKKPAQLSKTEQPHLLSQQRKSYYFSRDLTPPSSQPIKPDPPLHFADPQRKSSKQRRSTTKKDRASSNKLCGGAAVEPIWAKPDSTSEEYPNSPLESSPDSGHPTTSFDGMVSMSSSCKCKDQNDNVFVRNCKSLNPKLDKFDPIPTLELPPIITKNPAKFSEAVQEIKKKKKKQGNAQVSASSPGVRLRTNSPRIGSRRTRKGGSGSRRTLSESCAVVKSSSDPQRDFRESMVEMIRENNIRASKDLEDLLACYLQLNSDEYHELIIKVFKQIWFDLANVRLK
ncbi:hypothetical protein NMG60_11000080 [Bertholletia excelsa]